MIDQPTSLPRPSGSANVPGLVRLRLLNLFDVAHVEPPAPGSQTLSPGSVVMVAGRYPLDVPVVGMEATFSEEQSETAQGVLYRQAVAVVVPKDGPLHGSLMEPLMGGLWLALCQDANGTCRLVGRMEQPLRLAMRVDVGRNARTLTLATETCHPALYAAGVDDDFLLGAGTFVGSEFSTVFDL